MATVPSVGMLQPGGGGGEGEDEMPRLQNDLGTIDVSIDAFSQPALAAQTFGARHAAEPTQPPPPPPPPSTPTP